MNTYPRGSQHLGHLIAALNQHYVCAEDGGMLIYACGSATETLSCVVDPRHTGLAENKEFVARDRMETYTQVDLLADAFIASALKIKRQRVKISLFGEDDD